MAISMQLLWLFILAIPLPAFRGQLFMKKHSVNPDNTAFIKEKPGKDC